METFPPDAKPKKRQQSKATPCRWRSEGKPCQGKYHGNGGECSVCGRRNPRVASEQQLLRVTVSDGDGETRQQHLVEVRSFADFGIDEIFAPCKDFASSFPPLDALIFGRSWSPARAALHCALHRVSLALLVEVE